jgi:soluble lytic murein transglycosylase
LRRSHCKCDNQAVVLRAFFLLFLLPALANAANAQLQAKANEIRAHLDEHDFDRAEELVRELRAINPAAFTTNNYDYLLARLAQRRGRLAEAASLYLDVIKRNSILAQYALWHMAEISRASGELSTERQYLTRLLSSFPTSALVPRARDRMVESLLESGDTSGAIRLLRPIASQTGIQGRKAMVKLGEAYLKAGDVQAARLVFDQLLSGSRDDYALAAALKLDKMDKAAATKPDEFEALRRARIYLDNRHWPQARTHLLDILERFPNSPNRAEAIYQIGYCFYREDKYDQAIEWFERAHQEFPTKQEGEQGYYWVATALQKARRYDEAARQYEDFIAAYPKSNLIDKAYRNIVDCLRYAGKDEEAREWSQKIEQLYSGQPMAATALFNRAKIELARGNYQSALALFTRLSAQPISPKLLGAPAPGEIAFMRAYVIEQMGRLAEAASLYLAIPDERDNYFGHRATLRLQAMAQTEPGRRVIEPLARAYQDQARAALKAGRYAEAKDAATQALRIVKNEDAKNDLLQLLRACYDRLPAYSWLASYRLIPVARGLLTGDSQQASIASHQALASELIFLGLYDEGSIELRLGGFGNAAERAKDNLAYSLAVYSNRGDQAHYAISFAEQISKSIPRDYRLELLPRDLAELIYPAPYRDALDRKRLPEGVDPRLVLSLARQESRFNPNAKSSAAARGLLQLVTETALKLASEEKLERFEPDSVYEPEIAIRLASRYIYDLLKLFPNNPYAVAAAYNAGEQSVERWIFRSRSNDADRLVTEIPLPETKDYVAKVINNYLAYQQLYTEDLKPRGSQLK